MSRYCERFFPALTPLLLATIFVLENVLFNAWIKLPGNPTLGLFIFECFTLGILLYGPASLLPRKGRIAYNLIVSIVLGTILSAQFLNFSYSGGFLQASALKYMNQAGDEMGTVVKLLTPKLFAFFLGVGASIALPFARYERDDRARWKSRTMKVVALCSIVSIAALGYVALLFSGDGGLEKLWHPETTLHDLNSFAFAPEQTVERAGVCNYFIGDVIGLAFRSSKPTADQVAFARGTVDAKTPATSGKTQGIARGKNLILLQVESLDNSVIGKKIGGVEITPNLNKLTKQGVYFDNYFTQIGPGNTADAEFVTLTSLYPLTNTVAFIDFAHNDIEALPGTLKKLGYTTYALHGDVPNFWNRANAYPGLGYSEQISKSDFTTTENGFSTLPDDDFLSQSADMMTKFPRPFMATAITLSSHTPFEIPKERQTLDFSGDSSLTDRQKAYLQSVHYVDGAIGKFIDKLKANGLLDDSIVAIYGDHGSFTGTEEVIDAARTARTSETLHNGRVPLILLGKDLAKLKGTHSTPGSHLDLFPTLAHLLGASVPRTAFGHDLLTPTGAVMTHRDPYSDVVTDILTEEITYSNPHGISFEEGTCTKTATGAPLPLASCAALYHEQLENIRASDIIVRGNLGEKLAQAE